MTLLQGRAPVPVITAVVRVLVALRVTPTMLTTTGFLGNVAAGVLVAQGFFFYGGALLLIASGLDMFDGAVARATGTASRFGALYDSVLDRMSEAAVLFGLAWYMIGIRNGEAAALAFAAVVGSLLVSYVRARAEGLGLELKDGLFTRSERVVLTGVMLITGWVRGGLWVLAILSLATAFQRLWIAARALLHEDELKGMR